MIECYKAFIFKLLAKAADQWICPCILQMAPNSDSRYRLALAVNAFFGILF